jgi:hypothetical protein
MNKPTNSAARNTMSEFERQCFDWGFEDAEERIVKLLAESSKCTLDGGHHPFGYCFCEAIALIKGENK